MLQPQDKKSQGNTMVLRPKTHEEQLITIENLFPKNNLIQISESKGKGEIYVPAKFIPDPIPIFIDVVPKSEDVCFGITEPNTIFSIPDGVRDIMLQILIFNQLMPREYPIDSWNKLIMMPTQTFAQIYEGTQLCANNESDPSHYFEKVFQRSMDMFKKLLLLSGMQIPKST